jgi:hypothetical protein
MLRVSEKNLSKLDLCLTAESRSAFERDWMIRAAKLHGARPGSSSTGRHERVAQLGADDVRAAKAVLPNAKDGPPLAFEQASDQSISCTVSLILRSPVVGVRQGNVSTSRTAMPEAPVHKNGQPVFGKDEIRIARRPVLASPADNPGLFHQEDQP